ncbi:MAG: cell division protein FtsQ/DivIB [Alphaproteobacteria bacterium]|nr:cell division protein FtsQ/DivIB [Alphaproteobacteria bacterium]
MRLFKKKKGSQARRDARRWLLQARKAALLGTFVALAGAGAFETWHDHALQKCGKWAAAEALTRSARAGFVVRDIVVTGRHNTPNATLLSSLGVHAGMPVFGVDIAAAEQSLLGVSWIKDATVSRRLPDTIVVALQERTPIALWQHGETISLINKDGVVLETHDLEKWQGLPLVVGEGAENNVAELLTTLHAVPSIESQLVAAVRVGDRRWDLRLKNGITVNLPGQDMELALSRLAEMQQKKNILGRSIAGIDMRQPQRVMVTPAANDKTKTSI